MDFDFERPFSKTDLGQWVCRGITCTLGCPSGQYKNRQVKIGCINGAFKGKRKHFLSDKNHVYFYLNSLSLSSGAQI